MQKKKKITTKKMIFI